MKKIALMGYLEMDALCLLILLLIFLRSSNSMRRWESWLLFRCSLIFLMLVTVTDFTWALMEYDVISTVFPFHYLVNDAYYICATLTSAFWYFFTECELDTFRKKSHIFRALLFVPLLSVIALLIANMFNHCVFYFDENGIFHRGPLNFELFIIPLIYLVLSSFHPLIRAFQKKYYSKRTHYIYLSLFPLLSLATSTLQFFLPGTPLPCIGMTVAFLMVYMDRQHTLISLDPLTGLNNRNKMMDHLDFKIEHGDPDKSLFLLLLDLDNFKLVNDNYGHVEGDQALIRMAEVLTKTASIFGCFSSRYGGDEFVIIYETADEADIERLCLFVHEELKRSNQRAQRGYSLTTCIGWAKYGSEAGHIQALIARADAALYREKLNRAAGEE